MDRPHWVPSSAWPRLARVLERQPLHAVDALGDLEAMTGSWTPELRCLLLERVTRFAERDVALPAAVLLALGELVA